MPLTLNTPLARAALVLAILVGAPALADVKTGVEAWSRGDYSAAVKEWQGPAAAGDPDAMFNLAQAYRLGRGVAIDTKRAEGLYAKAAAAGHVQAADTYGLMLFQEGQRQAALPYIQDAAARDDPRAQYLLGIAHFNGELVAKDWLRAYALVTLANSAGLPQAASALAQMDQQIPLAQRQQATALAQTMRADAENAHHAQLAAEDLEAKQRNQPAHAAAAAPPRPAAATVAMSPSVAAAREAIAEASRAAGTENPADAGASFARRAAPARPPRAVIAVARTAPVRTAHLDAPVAAPKPTAPELRLKAAAPAPAPAPAAGAWRVQLGAFSVASNAQRQWDRASGRPELAGKERLLVPAGSVTKLQAGGFASRAAAEAACRALKADGIDCIATER